MKLEINKPLLRIACDMTSRGYTPENKGVREKMAPEGIMFYTPQNLKNVYDELVKLFSMPF